MAAPHPARYQLLQPGEDPQEDRWVDHPPCELTGPKKGQALAEEIVADIYMMTDELPNKAPDQEVQVAIKVQDGGIEYYGVCWWPKARPLSRITYRIGEDLTHHVFLTSTPEKALWGQLWSNEKAHDTIIEARKGKSGPFWLYMYLGGQEKVFRMEMYMGTTPIANVSGWQLRCLGEGATDVVAH